MPKALSKVVYKPDSQSTDEYALIVNPEEYKKWKEGDTSIPLTEVVDSFQILFSNQGNQGILGTPSKQQLETIFGSSKDVDVALIILQKGTLKAADGITSSTNTNFARGGVSGGIDTKGGNRTTGI